MVSLPGTTLSLFLAAWWVVEALVIYLTSGPPRLSKPQPLKLVIGGMLNVPLNLARVRKINIDTSRILFSRHSLSIFVLFFSFEKPLSFKANSGVQN